jgi:hypothetical protein
MMDSPRFVKIIKAHIERGDKAKDKAEQHYIAAGQHLKELKEQHWGDWEQWREKLREQVGIGPSRASELMQIADGRKTVDGIRAETAKRVMKHSKSSPLANGESRDLVVIEQDDAGDDERTEQEAEAPALRTLIYKRMVEGLSLILASPQGRNLTDEFLREVFEEFLSKRREVLPADDGLDIPESFSPAVSISKKARPQGPGN